MIGKQRDFTRRLRSWYDAQRRDLPWRLPREFKEPQKLNPYHVLVSELMLQQTQVATVIPYFHRFIEKFPTVAALAMADEQEVLRAWQGLGYYSRARNLQTAARQIIESFSGTVPSSVDQLLTLPGIGRYTAGAVSSIAFERRAPILDGNVARVLCRIDAIQSDPRSPAVRKQLWQRAEEILPASRPGDFNSALMELGALICTPRSPRCLLCPVRLHCQARAEGLQEIIPRPKPAKINPICPRWTFCIRDGNYYRVEQRPSTGRWAGMWQFVTLHTGDQPPCSKLIESIFSLRVTEPILLCSIQHALTHRRYQFDVYTCENQGNRHGEWATLQQLNDRPMPRPHLKIATLLK